MSRNEIKVAFRVMETKMPHFFCIVVICILSNLALFPSSEQDRALPLSPHLPPPPPPLSSSVRSGVTTELKGERGKRKSRKNFFPRTSPLPLSAQFLRVFPPSKKGSKKKASSSASDGDRRSVESPTSVPPAPTPHCTGEGGKLGMTRVGFQSRKRGGRETAWLCSFISSLSCTGWKGKRGTNQTSASGLLCPPFYPFPFILS